MKKTLILMATMLVSISGFSQTLLRPQTPPTGNSDPLDASQGLTQAQLIQVAQAHHGQDAAQPAHPKRPTMKAESTIDTISYFTAAQSYYTGYSFNADGGDVKTYHVGVAVNGNQVTFKNFFNLYNPNSYAPNVEYDMTGTYDATAKTITIPASTSFANATVVGDLMNYYIGTLIAGQITEAGIITPDENLVLHVDGDFDRIYSTGQVIGVAMWTPDGSTNYGVSGSSALLKDISINLPKEVSDLLVFQKNLNFGNTFSTTPITRKATIVNMGNMPCDYAMDISSDPEGAFTADALSGTVEGQGTQDITFTFTTPTTGDAEGLASIESESSDDPFNIQLTGTILPPPDFSPIVLRGDFEFGADLNYPFSLSEIDGKQVVRSYPLQRARSSSTMDATFTIPEGKLGKVSWKGVYEGSGYNVGGFLVDDFSSAYKTYNDTYEDASEAIEFAPGKHTIRFQYDCYSNVQDPTVAEGCRYYIWDLALDLTDLQDHAAILKDSLADIGFSVIGNDGKATATDNIVITNRGKNDLKLISVTSDNEEFSATTKIEPVATMKDLVIPVTLSTTTPGDKSAHLTIETSAGTFKASAKAIILAQQDFSKVVTEGFEYMTVENDAHLPYIIDGDSAYNANANYEDETAGTSKVTFHFTIPEGKLGIMSWDGYTFDQSSYNGDFGILEINTPTIFYTLSKFATGDAGSKSYAEEREEDPSFLNFIPGNHYISFEYSRNGDGVKAGKSMFSFKNLKLHVIDFTEHSAELQEDKVDFKPCHVGTNRWTTATVTLKNMGSADLVIDSIIGAGPFSGGEVKETAKFGKTLSVDLFFYPHEEGEFSDDIIIRTNAGDFTVACTGKTLSNKGLIYNGDLEDQCYGWSAYDGDGDGNTWMTAYMLFGGALTEEGYSRYCHSGSNLLGSASKSTMGEALTPDNWAVSPAITIPEEGGVLSYYVAALDPDHCAENYTVYVSETADYSRIDAEGEVLYDGLYELPEEYDFIPWAHYEYNLDQYKGKTIYIAFRHHECSGQYLLMIDDINVYQHGYEPSTSIDGVSTKNGFNKVKSIYSLDGQQHEKLQRGVNVVRMGDGSTRKVVIK